MTDKYQNQPPCSICGEPIDIQRTPDGVEYWRGGHNAWPVSEGRCCTACNYLHVIPTRLDALEKASITKGAKP